MDRFLYRVWLDLRFPSPAVVTKYWHCWQLWDISGQLKSFPVNDFRNHCCFFCSLYLDFFSGTIILETLAVRHFDEAFVQHLRSISERAWDKVEGHQTSWYGHKQLIVSKKTQGILVMCWVFTVLRRKKNRKTLIRMWREKQKNWNGGLNWWHKFFQWAVKFFVNKPDLSPKRVCSLTKTLCKSDTSTLESQHLIKMHHLIRWWQFIQREIHLISWKESGCLVFQERGTSKA